MNKKVRFMETVLRDGHQSLVATRMSTLQLLPILKTLDEAGYESLEVWRNVRFLLKIFESRSLGKIAGDKKRSEEHKAPNAFKRPKFIGVQALSG